VQVLNLSLIFTAVLENADIILYYVLVRRPLAAAFNEGETKNNGMKDQKS
jgi:hypothetical protein